MSCLSRRLSLQRTVLLLALSVRTVGLGITSCAPVSRLHRCALRDGLSVQGGLLRFQCCRSCSRSRVELCLFLSKENNDSYVVSKGLRPSCLACSLVSSKTPRSLGLGMSRLVLAAFGRTTPGMSTRFRPFSGQDASFAGCALLPWCFPG